MHIAYRCDIEFEFLKYVLIENYFDNILLYVLIFEVAAKNYSRSYNKSENLGKNKSDWTGLAGRGHPRRGEQTF